MSFALTEEQTMLRDTLRSFFAKRKEPRRSTAGAEVRDPALWRRLAGELGLLGLSFSEDDGGLGYGGVEAMIVMEEFGAALVAEPFVETVLMGSRLLAHAEPELVRPIIRGIIAGESTVVLAYGEPRSNHDASDVQSTARRQSDGSFRLNGHKAVVSCAPWANHLVISARTSGERRDLSGISLFLVNAASPGITRRDYPTLDGRAAADMLLEDVGVRQAAIIGREGQALPIIEQALDIGIAAVCAEAGGVMRELLAQSQAYTSQRRQGGRFIAEYQVLQHRMVDMMVATQQVRAMARVAANKVEAPAAERAMAASAAKAFAGRAIREVAQAAVQLHGAMGMTDEISVGRLFRRATVIEGQFGSVDHHLARYGALSLPQVGQA